MNEAAVVIFRSFLAFLLLLIFARILGKQQVAQLTFFEYVTGITIGSIAAEMSVELTSKALPHAVGLSMWFLMPLALQFITRGSRWATKVINGEPVIVIHNGKLLDKNMRIARYRVDDLLQQLRSKGIFDVSNVEFALLEANGELSVGLKSQHRPATPSDLGIDTEYEGLPTELIIDGRVLTTNLNRVNLSPEWLADRLSERGIASPKDVFLAMLNTDGRLIVDAYHDRLEHVHDTSDYPGVQ